MSNHNGKYLNVKSTTIKICRLHYQTYFFSFIYHLSHITFSSDISWYHICWELKGQQREMVFRLKPSLISYDVVSKNLKFFFCISIYGDNHTFRVEIAVQRLTQSPYMRRAVFFRYQKKKFGNCSIYVHIYPLNSIFPKF